MAKYQVLYWHDIPVQVRADDRGGRVNRPLPDRFQAAIDRAAMEAGLTASDQYAEAFRWSAAQIREGAAADVAQHVAAEIEARHAAIDWRATVAAIRGQAT